MTSLRRLKKLQQENHNQSPYDSPHAKPDHDSASVDYQTSTQQHSGPLISLDRNSPVSSPRVNGRRSLVKRNKFKKIRENPSKKDKILPNHCNRISTKTNPEPKSSVLTTSSSADSNVTPVTTNSKQELRVATTTENDDSTYKDQS